MAPTFCQARTASLKHVPTMTPTCTQQLMKHWSTHTCWKTQRSAYTESLIVTCLRLTQIIHRFLETLTQMAWRLGFITLYRLRPFLRGLKANRWWTMRFTRLQTGVRRNSLPIWGLGWSQREETEEDIGLAFCFLPWDIYSLASVWWPAVQSSLFFLFECREKKISIQACYFVLSDEKHIFKAVLNHHIAALAIKSSDVAFRCRICFSWGVLVQGVDVGAGANLLFTCWVVHSLSPHHWTKHFTAAAKHHIFISPSESDGFLMSCVAEDWGRRVSRVSSFIKQFFPLRWRPPDIFLLMCLWGSVYRLPWWKYLHSWFSDRYK